MKSKSEQTGWYPGKFLKERRASKAKADSKASSSFDGTSVRPVSEDGSESAHGATAMAVPRRRVYGPEKSVGQVTVKLLDMRFVSATKPVLEVTRTTLLCCELTYRQFSSIIFPNQVSFDNQCDIHSFLPDQYEPKEIIFPIGNVSADINIRLIEEYSVGGGPDIRGVVVLPLTRYFGATLPTPPKPEWLQFFPYNEVQAVSAEDSDSTSDIGRPATVTLRSGDASLPGSAMNKNKQSIGFVCVQVEVFLIEPAYKLYLKSCHPKAKWNSEHEVSLLSTHSEVPYLQIMYYLAYSIQVPSN